MNQMIRTQFILPLVLGCAGKDDADTGPFETPTYTRDVAPILDSRCAGCHTDGGIAPMPLTGFDEVSGYADWVADAVVDRRMPPGQPGDGCAEYTEAPGLTDEEVDTIARWAEGGAPEGDAADATDVSPHVDSLAMERVDLTLTMPEPYTPTTSPDDYRCFLVDWPEEETVYVTGFGMVPGQPSIVHHVIAYPAGPETIEYYEGVDAADDGPGYTCYGGPGGEPGKRARWLGGWAPGGQARALAEGTGIAIEPGSKMILQVHYNTSEALAVEDQTSMEVMIEASVEDEGEITPVADFGWVFGGEMVIPAGATGETFTYSEAWDHDAWLHDVGMHMHGLGRGGEVSITHADGTETCLQRMDDWDFNWQMAYRLSEPVFIAEGDELNVTCVFDNPTGEDVAWGEATTDEMCLGIVYHSLAE